MEEGISVGGVLLAYVWLSSNTALLNNACKTAYKVGVVTTNKPTGGENPLTNNPPIGEAQVQQESTNKWKKRQS